MIQSRQATQTPGDVVISTTHEEKLPSEENGRTNQTKAKEKGGFLPKSRFNNAKGLGLDICSNLHPKKTIYSSKSSWRAYKPIQRGENPSRDAPRKIYSIVHLSSA